MHANAPPPAWSLRRSRSVCRRALARNRPRSRAHACPLARSCHLTRDTGRALRDAGFDTSQLEAFEVEGLGILAPHVAGVLTV